MSACACVCTFGGLPERVSALGHTYKSRKNGGGHLSNTLSCCRHQVTHALIGHTQEYDIHAFTYVSDARFGIQIRLPAGIVLASFLNQ